MKIMDKASDSNDSSVAQVVERKVLSRTLWLLIGALLGLALIGVLFFYLMPAFFEASIQGRTSYAVAVRLVPLVIMLAGSVPVTVLLWLFRTHDAPVRMNYPDKVTTNLPLPMPWIWFLQVSRRPEGLALPFWCRYSS